MTETSIEWTDAVWNPVTGCTKVSEGCRHCYAETIAGRFWGARQFADVQCHDGRLEQPLRWRKPRRVFVNSMSDLFHPDVPTEFIARVFEVMARCPQHVFQVLTKRPERMCRLLPLIRYYHSTRLDHIWLGVSVEDQATADARIPLLLQTPATVRFVSCEPLLGPIRFKQQNPDGFWPPNAPQPDVAWLRHKDWPDDFQYWTTGLQWVIVGGESGAKARRCNVTWIRSIVQQCQAAGTPCFVKQLGAQPYEQYAINGGVFTDPMVRPRLKSRKGNDPSEWPEDLRVREMLEVGK